MRKLESVEQLGSNIIDEASGCFGNIMREIFEVKRDEWNENLKKIGFYIGKFIYLMDAYEDIEKDINKNNYISLFLFLELKL